MKSLFYCILPQLFFCFLTAACEGLPPQRSYLISQSEMQKNVQENEMAHNQFDCRQEQRLPLARDK